MTDDQKKAWEELVAVLKFSTGPTSDAILAADAELKRLREALACTSENCSEFGHIHDGDCYNCPQGTIRARAGLADKSRAGMEG